MSRQIAYVYILFLGILICMSRSSRLHIKNKKRPDNHLLDKVVLAVAIIEPLTTLGQIIQIGKYKDAKGNSLATWIFYTIAAFIWLLYGLKIKNKPVIISSLLWVVMEGVVVIEILYYS